MTLPTSGAISIGAIANELGISASGLSLNDSRVRALAGVPSGTISMYSFYGKSNLKAVGNSANGSAISSSAAGNASCSPSATVTSGGGASITFAWSFVSNPSSCTLGNVGSQSCVVSHAFARNSVGSAVATLQCVVSNGSASVTVQAGANLSWGTNQ